MVNREYDALADDFVELGLLPTGANRQATSAITTSCMLCTLSRRCSHVSLRQLVTVGQIASVYLATGQSTVCMPKLIVL